MAAAGIPSNLTAASPALPEGQRTDVRASKVIRPRGDISAASGQLTVADAATGTVVARFTVGGLPDAVAASPDGSRVYLAGAAGHLDVIDASTGKVIAAVTLGGAPDAVALRPGGSTVYVAGAAAKVLFVVDAATGQIRASGPAGRGAIGVAVS